MKTSEKTIPAYMRIRQYAVDLVHKEAGSELRIPSENELCAMFSVTRPTVRRALKDLIQDGYLTVHPGLGTYTNPKKDLSLKNAPKAFSAAVIIGDGKSICYSPFHAEILSGIFKRISRAGGFVRIGNIISMDRGLINEVKRLNVDGIIWIGPPNQELVEMLGDAGIRVISVNRGFNNPKIDYCGLDFKANGKLIANYFLDKGVKDILYSLRSGLEYENEIFSGFLEAFKERGLSYNQGLALTDGSCVKSDILKMIKFGVKFSGVYTEGILLGENIEALRESKGAFDSPPELLTQEHAARNFPELNCAKIYLPLEEIGEMAAEALLGAAEGKSRRRIFRAIPGKILLPE